MIPSTRCCEYRGRMSAFRPLGTYPSRERPLPVERTHSHSPSDKISTSSSRHGAPENGISALRYNLVFHATRELSVPNYVCQDVTYHWSTLCTTEPGAPDATRQVHLSTAIQHFMHASTSLLQGEEAEPSSPLLTVSYCFNGGYGQCTSVT